MAKLEFLLQAVTSKTHGDVLAHFLKKGFEKVLLGVAFTRAQGVQAFLEPIAVSDRSKVTVFLGIRNGVTSYQALELLFFSGITVYTVDTGATTTIFHPKVFLVQGKKNSNVIIGSANLTFNGLNNNIEASSLIELDLENSEDCAFEAQIFSSFHKMVTDFPKHVKKVEFPDDILEMTKNGLLIDEAIEFKTVATPNKGNFEEQSLMPLHRKTPISVIKRISKSARIDQLPIAGNVVPLGSSISPSAPSKDEFYLVWQSLELKERDLNIPTGVGTNPTGSMYWKKGAYENIDQRHHFRDEVFSGLSWEIDWDLPHYERAHALFHIIVMAKYQGGFNLKLSHNNNIESTTYKQKNSMTQVSWGIAKELIAKRNLLGRIMYLYRKDTSPPQFLIQID